MNTPDNDNDTRFLARLYAVRDDKMNMIDAPFVCENDDVAKRIFGDVVNGSSDSIIAKHPDDFSVWFVGYVDRRHISLLPEQAVKLASGSDFIKENANE